MQNQKSIQAYKVNATLPNQSFANYATALTANSESEAIAKAKHILNLTEEHIFSVRKIEVFNTDTKLQHDDYPYGRLRTTIFFNVEHNKKKGYRVVSQTINPKTGRINNPKKSTYNQNTLICRSETGRIYPVGYLSFNGSKEINRGLHFMNDFFELFTPEQIEETANEILLHMLVNIKASVIYCNSDFDEMKKLCEVQIAEIKNIAKTKENNFLNCILDVEKMDSLKEEGYQPFKVVETLTIG